MAPVAVWTSSRNDSVRCSLTGVTYAGGGRWMRDRLRGTAIVRRICSVAAAVRVLASGGRTGDPPSPPAEAEAEAALPPVEPPDAPAAPPAALPETGRAAPKVPAERLAAVAVRAGAGSAAAAAAQAFGMRFMRHLMRGSARTSVADGRVAASTQRRVLTMFFMSSL